MSFKIWVELDFIVHEICKLEGNGPIDSRVMVIIYNSILGLIFEIRSINYPLVHVHDAKALSQIFIESQLTADRKQTADMQNNNKF